MRIISFLFLGCAIYMIYNTIRTKKEIGFSLIFAGALLISPILALLAVLLETPILDVVGAMWSVGVVLLVSQIKIESRFRKCTEPVSAICIDGKAVDGREKYFFPVFEYTFEDTQYQEQSFMNYSKRKFRQLFDNDGTCEVCVDPKNPKMCADKRTHPKSTIGIIASVLFIALGIALFIATL